MGLNANTPMTSIKIDKVFIGSCTNSRIEDLRAAAAVVLALAGKRVAEGVYAMIVPGSGLVKQEAEAMGLDKIFVEAGFDWREAGCSMVSKDERGVGNWSGVHERMSIESYAF